MTPRGPALQKLIQSTLQTCSDLVGSTLGPGGMSVVIERQEVGLPPIVTKDGVTVFQSLGFEDPTQQVLMEAARQASVRTASEAGDGTTTATILSEALVRYTHALTYEHPDIVPQRVSRIMERLLKTEVLPTIQGLSRRCTLDSEAAEGKERNRLYQVARISTNGDAELAKAVMDCYDIVGDQGNVTIVEDSGPSSYRVEKIEGYPVPIGYEECAGVFFQEFINDPGTQQAILESPLFLLYHGRINDYNDLFQVLGMVAQEASTPSANIKPNVVVVATGFSDSVLANMAASFKMPGVLHVYPLVAPKSSSRTGQYDFLLDMAALTGCQVFDPLNAPLHGIQSVDELGRGPTSFQASRYRSVVVGYRDELLVMERVDQLAKQLTADTVMGEQERTFLRERMAKLTSGIARLIVTGPSNAEVKEKRDRAEDAICAVRGAIAHGALPGGGAVLLELARQMRGLRSRESYRNDTDTVLVATAVLSPAFEEPVLRLFLNSGYSEKEARNTMADIRAEEALFDISQHQFIKSSSDVLLDSAPAVTEAIRNSMSVAGLLGTCGGTVVFQRDPELERREAKESADFVRSMNVNEANERG
jgi:chaperonin GroEL